jgi:hypothetical protein
MYFAGRFSGYNTCQTYYSSDPILSLAIEPNTSGMLVVTGAGLYYTDRREPVPDNLYRTVLTEEPLYGLQVLFDPTVPGDQRYLTLTPVPYAGASKMVQYRFWVQAPDGGHWGLTQNGEPWLRSTSM